MGVYIKGMEMPKSCADCPCGSVFAGYKCMACGKQFDKYPLENRMDWCPLTPVPSHGDLIDREALIKALHAWFDDDEVHAFEKDAYWHHGVVMKIINNVPTIISAEEGEMDKRGCPPDYNGGFCADYDVDCKICWEQWEQEHKAEKGE